MLLAFAILFISLAVASARHIIGQMDRAVQMDVDRWMQAARSTQIILDNKEG